MRYLLLERYKFAKFYQGFVWNKVQSWPGSDDTPDVYRDKSEALAHIALVL